MRLPVQEVIGGTTFKATWVNSGVLPGAISSSIIDRTGTVVQSLTAVSSGNGFYYALMHVPASPGWYVNEWVAQISVNTYVNRQFVRAYTGDVD